MARQRAWADAMRRVDAMLSCRSVEWVRAESDALLLRHVDDRHALQNSAGQNMSILFASKP
eukprot:3933306-Rhodomonas_salina.1